MSDMPMPKGKRVKRDGRWYTVASCPDPLRAGLHRWRDGQAYDRPELVNWDDEGRANTAPIPSEPEPRFTILKARP